MKFLIVDSSNLFHDVVASSLNELPSETTVLNGQTAAETLEILVQNTVDFICLSLFLEDMDGIELAKLIRQQPRYQYTPIVLLTSEESPHIYAKALSAGLTEVFHKKDFQQLINFITRFTSQQAQISGRILYIEDTLSQRKMVTQMFTSRGLEVDAFSTAEEAWEAYLKNDYDLVVTDIILEGGMTGMALTNHIRRLNNEKGDIPILAITAFDDISRRIELFYLGVSDYVIKPLIEEELIARVKNLISSKKFHTESIEQRKRAEEADNAKSTFLTQMSHELRTPLNAIIGYSDLMITDVKQPLIGLQKESVAEIKQAGNLLLTLINDLLDLSSIEAKEVKLNIKPSNLSRIVEQAIKQIDPVATLANIEIEPYTIPQNIEVNVDPTRLHQILLNLLSNAVKYNKTQGTIKILCKKINNDIIRLAIKDTGLGLTEQQQSGLFAPFHRLPHHAEIQGSGLGLVICRQFMEAMGGKVGLKSKPGTGSTFWVDLPQ
ncbi:MAG: hypothetical protein COA90_11040 [Gammaproteobacteria bacterium]|nr:MAG: hypothetical protein COA90_11040 [Gammaproteobacteria bacterium]